MAPWRRVLSPVLRGSTAYETPPSTPRNEALGLGRLEPGDTPQGKRSKVTLPQLPAVVCPAAQKSQLLQWKQKGLQLLNHHDQCANTQDAMVREALSASASVFFRRRRHGWIEWASKEHGILWYRFEKQVYQWFQEAKVAIAAMSAKRVVQAGKRPYDIPRMTPPKKLKPACSRDMLLHGIRLMPDDGRSR